MFRVADNYPGDTAKGGDYITSSAVSEIVTDPDAPARMERVIVTDIMIDFEGRLCFGEKTVRHMAHLLGMYEPEYVEAMQARVGQAAAALREANERLDQFEAFIAASELFVHPRETAELMAEPAPRKVPEPVEAQEVSA